MDGDPVSIIAATSPANGSVTYAGKSVTYSPAGAGSDAFVVTVTDGNGAIATTQVGVDGRQGRSPAQDLRRLVEGRRSRARSRSSWHASPASRPRGKVKLKVGGQTLTVTLKKGVATFKIAELPDAAQLKVKAKYLGDGQYAAGSAKKTFKLT